MSTANKQNGGETAFSLRLDDNIRALLAETMNLLKSTGLNGPASDVEQLMKEIVRNRFTVAVVGEFSKGKSTFVNKLFGRDILPVANTPTTAMLTKIRHNPEDMLVVMDMRGGKKNLPLTAESWKGYTAAIDGSEPSGVAFVGINDEWLKKGIEIIDTPGAGDLEEKRAALIGDALRGSDGAIITISAEAALSMSEKLFIEERLISKKVPYLMLILTKLDRIPERQRAGIIEYVKTKLNMWKLNVPVHIPYQVEIPGSDYSDVMGMDKIKNRINSWISDPNRKKLTTQWVVSKVLSLLESACSVLNERLLLEGVSPEQKATLISEKQALLAKAQEEWKNLRIKMVERSNACYNQLVEKSGEYIDTITERMQYELSHTGNPQKWWSEDFPYRLKLEMTNMSSGLENTISRRIAEDARWFNAILEKNFQSHVLFTPESIADKSVYSNIALTGNIQVDDLNKKRNVARVGSTVLSIVGFLACSAIGIPPIIGSMGVGTGSSLVTEGLFKKKTEEQKAVLKNEIAATVPVVVKKAMLHSENRVRSMYDNIIQEADKQEKKWLDSQKATITHSADNATSANQTKIKSCIDLLKKQSAKFEAIL